jgi:hypothetical protein
MIHLNTVGQFLNLRPEDYPLNIKDKNGNTIYSQELSGEWVRREFDRIGRMTYAEESDGTAVGEKRGNQKKNTLTLEEISKLSGIPLADLKIIK